MQGNWNIRWKRRSKKQLSRAEFIASGELCIEIKEIVADDFINHTAITPVPNNVDGLKQFVSMLHKGFSNFHIDNHEQVCEDDIVVTRKTIHAIHSEEIMDTNPRVKRWPLALWILFVFVMEDILSTGDKTMSCR